MNTLFNNPLEWLVNRFGYTTKVKRTPIYDAMLRCTNNNWIQDLRDSNRLTDYQVRLWTDNNN